MRTSSNPAFRNLPTSPGGYARFGRGPAPAGMAGAGGMFGGRAAARCRRRGLDDRPLTVDDVVQKTALNAVLAIAVGIASAVVGLGFIGIIGGLVVGLVLALIIIFKQSTNKALVLGYSLAEGVALGSLTGLLESSSSQYAGIGFQAILGVMGVFIGMLVVYKTGAIRVTPRLTKMVIGAAIGVLILMVANLLSASSSTAAWACARAARWRSSSAWSASASARSCCCSTSTRPTRRSRPASPRGSRGTWPSAS